MKQMALLALAGACGTLSRLGVSGLVQHWCGDRFPGGTLAVNVIGCFLFGFVWTLAEDRLVISGQTRFIILAGFMGAFTTFSTFGFETATMLQNSQWFPAATNILIQNLGGIVAVILGMAAGRLF